MSESKETMPQESPSQRVRRLKQEAFRFMDEVEFHKRINDFSEELERRFKERSPDDPARWGEYTRYKAYHWLVGSTPPDSADLEDLEGEDSIESFLTALLERARKNHEQ
jgi:hypothetical protein